jgi:broad specificity phosphatase PhoE
MRSFLAEVAVEHRSGRIVVIGHSAARSALEHLMKALPVEDVVTAPFDLREGWLCELTPAAESTAAERGDVVAERALSESRACPARVADF